MSADTGPLRAVTGSQDDLIIEAMHACASAGDAAAAAARTVTAALGRRGGLDDADRQMIRDLIVALFAAGGHIGETGQVIADESRRRAMEDAPAALAAVPEPAPVPPRRSRWRIPGQRDHVGLHRVP